MLFSLLHRQLCSSASVNIFHHFFSFFLANSDMWHHMDFIRASNLTAINKDSSSSSLCILLFQFLFTIFQAQLSAILQRADNSCIELVVCCRISLSVDSGSSHDVQRLRWRREIHSRESFPRQFHSVTNQNSKRSRLHREVPEVFNFVKFRRVKSF